MTGAFDMGQPQDTDDRATVINRGFAWMTRWGIRIIVLAIATLIIGWLIGRFWMILFPISMALILCTVLAPPVAFLRRHRWPDALAAIVVLVSFLGLLAAAIVALWPSVQGQSGEIAKGASQGLARIQDWLVDGPLGVTENQIQSLIGEIQTRLQDSAADIGAGVLSTLGAATNVIINIVLALMLTFFFLKDGHRFIPWLQAVGGSRAGEHLAEVLTRCWNTLGGFIRAQGIVSSVSATAIGIALVIMDVPLAIPLAVITFAGGFIPIVGAFVAGALAVLITLVTIDLQAALIILLVIVIAQQLEGNVLSPWLQGRTMKLHAAVVLMSVAAGGTLFGITGAFLAVPVAATVAEILRYINEQIDKSVGPEAPPDDSRSAELLDDLAAEADEGLQDVTDE